LAEIRIARKDAEIYYFKFPSIMMGLLLSSFMYLSFSFGRDFSSSVS
jgi:hypothetical protein